MSKNKSPSKVFCADDSTEKSSHDDRSSFSTKNAVCDPVQLSDNLASCFGSSENKVDCRTSNNATEDVEMLPEFTAREMVADVHISCKSPHSNEKMGKNKDPIVPGVNTNEGGRVIATKGGLQAHETLDTSDPLWDTKVILDGSNSQASAAGQSFQDEDVKQSADCMSLSDRDEKAYELNGPDQFSEVNKCPPVSSQEAESDNSDLEEQDVKVCDICGDAGREDLLAICNRCTDGAEHTYCMREMLDKVPDGKWLCEECKSNEEIVKQRQGHSEVLDGKERNKQSSNSFAKLRKKDSSSGATRADNDMLAKRLQTKRRGSDMEVDPAVKRQVLESAAQSPSTSSPGRNHAPSRDNSFKNLDKMNVKLSHQTSISRSEGVEKPWSPNGSHVKGSFFKSNSFGSSSSKPKVKMVDEIPQKHKQGVDVKDGSSKLLGKAMSLKGSLSRSNTTETKVKMLSPKDSHILESRGLKQPKERALFDRKNSFKTDHSSVSQVATDGSKNQVRGDAKRQSLSHPSGLSSSINSSVSCADPKTIVSLKEGCTSTSSQLDGVDNSNEKPKQGVGVANGTSRSSALDTSLVRSLKDGTNEENKLKAAIQAAMQKRLDMCKRKSAEIPVSNAHSASETASSDRPNSVTASSDRPNSTISRNSVPAKGIHEAETASPSCTFGSGLEVPDKNLSNSRGFPAGSMVSPLARDSVMMSNIGHLLTKSAIPEHEFSWLGSFEVYRGGNSPEHISGIQAHISTCASHKVLEMVKKFPQKVSLNEVPRSRTWPTQFQDGAADEDNVAVYFFARDVDSYERSYKNLLEKMMKDDLALKGNIDGFELLIFPSKQLIKSSQRWNMLFFIWGVFRGKAGNCQDYKPDCTEKLDLYGLTKDKCVASDFKCPSEKLPLYRSAKENISTTESAQGVGGDNVTASVFVSGKQSASLSNGDCDLGKRFPHSTNSYGKFGHPDGIYNSLSTCHHPEARDVDTDSLNVAERQISTSPGGGRNPSARAEMMSCDQTISQEATSLEVPSVKQTVTIVKDDRTRMKTEDPLKDRGCQMQLEGGLNNEEASKDNVNDPGHPKLEDNPGEKEQHKKMQISRAIVDLECELKQAQVDEERKGFVWSKSLIRAMKMGNVNDQPWLHGEPPQEVCKSNVECPLRGQKRSVNDMNVVLDEVDEGMRRGAKSSSLFSHTSSSPSEKTYKAVSNSKEMCGGDSSSAETERFFFPVGSQPANFIQSPLGWSVASSASGIDHSSDGSPSLELALGVENKPTKAGFVQPPDVERKKEDEEAALSLSLAFPFADKGVCVRGGTQQAFPRGRLDE